MALGSERTTIPPPATGDSERARGFGGGGGSCTALPRVSLSRGFFPGGAPLPCAPPFFGVGALGTRLTSFSFSRSFSRSRSRSWAGTGSLLAAERSTASAASFQFFFEAGWPAVRGFDVE